MKIKSILSEWKIILMVICLITSIVIINPNFNRNGVLVTSVSSATSSYLSSGIIIKAINGISVNNLSDYTNILSSLNEGEQVIVTYLESTSIFDNKLIDSYPFFVNYDNNESNIGLSVIEVPFSNLDFGIDLVGGTKVVLKPVNQTTIDELEMIVNILETRLNVYGFKEIPINYVQDYNGDYYIKVSLPSSVSVESIEELLENEGVFEARIANQTVFTGQDIQSVCMTGVDCTSEITAYGDGFVFRFSLLISEEGAEKFANVTEGLSKNEVTGSTCYLNESIGFYIDNVLLDGGELQIGCSLKEQAEREPSISGGGKTLDETKEDMIKLKSMLTSNNLPVGLNIESVEVVSPKLGQEFLQNILWVFILAILGVDLIISIRYKSFKIAIPIIIVTFSEIFITLGVATLFQWTFDLSAIAGLIASVGTGVDDQIIITDEVLSEDNEGKSRKSLNYKIKDAFLIVIITFATSVAVMIPLAVAGVGLLKGFATTSIISILVGVIITRPAYARIMGLLFK